MSNRLERRPERAVHLREATPLALKQVAVPPTPQQNSTQKLRQPANDASGATSGHTHRGWRAVGVGALAFICLNAASILAGGSAPVRTLVLAIGSAVVAWAATTMARETAGGEMAGETATTPRPENPAALRVMAAGLDNLGGALIRADADGRIIEMNATAARLTGWSEEDARGMPLDSVFVVARGGAHASTVALVSAARDSTDPIRMTPDTVVTARSGEQRPITGTCVRTEGPTGASTLLVFRDVGVEQRAETDRVSLVSMVAQARTEVAAREHVEATLRETEDQLRHAQKMEAVGRLAGGAAHDFNNALSVILSYTELIMSDLDPEDPIREDLTAIRHAGKRAAELTRQLLLFSRHDMVQPQVLDLNGVLVGTEKMLRRLVGEDVEFSSAPGALDATVLVDPGSLEHMIMNLAVNARDAMPDGGKLSIATANAVVPDDGGGDYVGVKPGRYVELTVADTGTGMDLATQAKMFEPFFTTKERGKGTGLGLSTVFGIVKQSGGHIEVDTEPGRGTTFHVLLPLIEDRADEAGQKASPRQSRGSETVLLVEDEEHVRLAARAILKRQGYQILDAGTPREALALAETHDGPIDLLLTDVVMPQMSGPELVARLEQVRGGTTVLFMSGYSDDSELRKRVLESGIALLQKPFTFDTLAKRVREVLDSNGDKPALAERDSWTA